MTTATKITIKPVGGLMHMNEHDVYVDGEHVARFMFIRTNDVYRDGNGSRRTNIRCNSWVEDVKSGKRFDNLGYCWFRDITRDMRDLYGRGQTYADMF